MSADGNKGGNFNRLVEDALQPRPPPTSSSLILSRLFSPLVCCARAAVEPPTALTAHELRTRAANLRALCDYTNWLADEIYAEQEDDKVAKLKAPRASTSTLTPEVGRQMIEQLRQMRPGSGEHARAGEPSLFSGEPQLFVGAKEHAEDASMLWRLGIRGVLTLACKKDAPENVEAYERWGMRHATVEAEDDDEFQILKKALPRVSVLIEKAHAAGKPLLIYSSAGVNRAPTLAVAYIMLRDRRNLFELLEECMASRPNMLANPSFQLQLAQLAYSEGLLERPKAWSPHMPGLTPASWNRTFVIPQRGKDDIDDSVDGGAAGGADGGRPIPGRIADVQYLIPAAVGSPVPLAINPTIARKPMWSKPSAP